MKNTKAPEQALGLTLSLKVRIVRFSMIVFNIFGFTFGGLMTLDFFHYRLDLPDNTFFMLTGGALVVALVSLIPFYLYKPALNQPCPHCGEKVLFFLNWHCDSCNTDQKKPKYIVERCGSCKERLRNFACPHCNALIDLEVI